MNHHLKPGLIKVTLTLVTLGFSATGQIWRMARTCPERVWHVGCSYKFAEHAWTNGETVNLEQTGSEVKATVAG